MNLAYLRELQHILRQGKKEGVSGVKFTAFTSNDGITSVMFVRREDEAEVKCIQKGIDISKDNGKKILRFMLGRGYSFESIILACLKS